MRTPLALAAAAALLLAPAPSPAAPAGLPHNPKAGWVVDFAEHQCLASRDYGSAADPLFLALKPSPMGAMMQIMIVFRARAASEPTEAPVAIRVNGGPPIAAHLLAFNGKRPGLRQVQINVPLDAFAPMRQAARVSFESREVNETFALAQMPALMTQMDRCVADLRRYWNIDAAPPLRSRASAHLGNIIRSEDYPAVAISKEEGGAAEFSLLIDEAGKVADCVVVQTSNVPVLDAQACALITTRARFKPATNGAGKPAKDALTTSVTWRIEG
jgi:TonB family protein